MQGLESASPEQLSDISIVSDGAAIRWEQLDADFCVPNLAAGIFGTRLWMIDNFKENK